MTELEFSNHRFYKHEKCQVSLLVNSECQVTAVNFSKGLISVRCTNGGFPSTPVDIPFGYVEFMVNKNEGGNSVSLPESVTNE